MFCNGAVDVLDPRDTQNVAMWLGIRAEAALLRDAPQIQPDSSRSHHACTMHASGPWFSCCAARLAGWLRGRE
jgi:hypothetical protein